MVVFPGRRVHQLRDTDRLVRLRLNVCLEGVG
jgi:hypothetical protein